MSMVKKYLVTGSYADKQTGKMVSSMAPISAGVSKSGSPYEIADTTVRETVEGRYAVGTILQGTMSLTVTANADSTQEPRSVKLTKE